MPEVWRSGDGCAGRAARRGGKGHTPAPGAGAGLPALLDVDSWGVGERSDRTPCSLPEVQVKLIDRYRAAHGRAGKISVVHIKHLLRWSTVQGLR